MRIPDDATAEFLQIVPFAPRQKCNMSGWLASHCDPQDYGQLKMYTYPRGSILPGPKQMEANFNQTPEIANLNTLLKNAQSQIIVGNLLVVPIGNSVMYVEPMFLESTSPGITKIPELKKVVLAEPNRIVVADSYAEALKKLFGNVAPATLQPSNTSTLSPPTPQPPNKQNPQTAQVNRAQVQEAL